MSNDLAWEILARVNSGAAELVYGEATGTNTVTVAGASTAVTLPALNTVRNGEYVAILKVGADRLILGAVGRTWTSFTPSWTNLTPENGTNTGHYLYVPGGIWVKAQITFGTTTSVTGGVSMTIPNGETSRNDGTRNAGSIYMLDNSTAGDYSGVAVATGNSTSIALYADNNNVSTTVPFAWAQDDSLALNILIAL